MCPAYGADISIAGPAEPFEALVDDHIVDEEISKAIGHHPKSDGLQPIYFIEGAKQDTKETGNGEDDKEGIVLFKEAGLWLW